MFPAEALHVTAVLVVPNAYAENGCTVPIGTVAAAGEIETATWGFVMVFVVVLPLPAPHPVEAQQIIALAKMPAKRNEVVRQFEDVDILLA